MLFLAHITVVHCYFFNQQALKLLQEIRMSHGKKTNWRSNADSSSSTDWQEVDSYRHEKKRRSSPFGGWITEESDVQIACLDILRGKPGKYPIFGIKLHVEMRDSEDGEYPVLVYTDALYGVDGQNLFGLIRPRFIMSPAMLSWTIGENTRFRTEAHELLTRVLLAQPEMQVARELFAREQVETELKREQTERKIQKEGRANLLVQLRGKPVDERQEPKPKIATPPVLDSLREVLTAKWGTIAHDNLTILVCRSQNGAILVRLKEVPEVHVMAEVAEKNIFIYQQALRYSEDRGTDSTDQIGSHLLSYKLRMYLRNMLMESGIILKAPAKEEAFQSDHSSGADIQKVVGNTKRTNFLSRFFGAKQN